MSIVLAVLAALGGAVLFLLRVILILLIVVLAIALLALLCPFCADLAWEGDPEGETCGRLKVRIGALGFTLPIYEYPAPPPEEPAEGPEPGWAGRFWGKIKAKLAARREARRLKREAKREARRPASAPPRQKARLTLHVLCTLLRGAGRLTRAVFAALRVTRIRIFWPVGGEEPAQAAWAYGAANGWLYPSLGFLNRFVYLDFEELRLVPCLEPDAALPPARVSFRVSARALFVFLAAVGILIEFYREKVLDVFL